MSTPENVFFDLLLNARERSTIKWLPVDPLSNTGQYVNIAQEEMF